MNSTQEFSDQFSREVEAFLIRHDLKPTTLGKRAAGDPNFVAQVRSGRSPTLAKADSVRRWMREFETQPAGE